MLVHEEFLHVLQGVAYEPVRLVAPLLFLLRLALGAVRELHRLGSLVELRLAAQSFRYGPVAIILALPLLAVEPGLSTQTVYPRGISSGPECQHPAQRQVRLGMASVTARVSLPQPGEPCPVGGCKGLLDYPAIGETVVYQLSSRYGLRMAVCTLFSEHAADDGP